MDEDAKEPEDGNGHIDKDGNGLKVMEVLNYFFFLLIFKKKFHLPQSITKAIYFHNAFWLLCQEFKDEINTWPDSSSEHKRVLLVIKLDKLTQPCLFPIWNLHSINVDARTGQAKRKSWSHTCFLRGTVGQNDLTLTRNVWDQLADKSSVHYWNYNMDGRRQTSNWIDSQQLNMGLAYK